MPTTSSAIQAILSIKKEFNFDTKVLKLTDQSAYGTSLTLTAPWASSGIYKVLDPTGAVAYINTGFDTNDFTAPDTVVTNTSTAANNFSFSLPLATDGTIIQGTYLVYMLGQMIEDVGGANTTTLFSLNSGFPDNAIGAICPPTVTASQTVLCATALITDKDTTNYGSYVSLTRVHQLIPPPLSGQPTQTTSGTSITYSSTPFTGMWSWKIVSTLVYLTGVNTYLTITLTGEAEFVVQCDTNFCKLLCLVRKYYNTYFSTFGVVATQQDARNWLLVMSNFEMAYHEMLCGRADSEIQKFIDTISEITGLSPECNCGCGGDTPTPIIPTNIINGAPGTDGTNGVTPQLRVSGGFIQVSYDSGATFTNLLSLATITGPAGAAGVNGISELWSEPSDHSVPNTFSNRIIATGTTDHTNPAKNLVNVGDFIIIYALTYCNDTSSSATASVALLLNTTDISALPNNSGVNNIGGTLNTMTFYKVRVSLQDATPGAMILRIQFELTNFAQSGTKSWAWQNSQTQEQDLTGQNFNLFDNTFNLQINQATASSTICSEWIGIITKK